MHLGVTPRHIVLVVASVAVLALGVYFWREVNASPSPTGGGAHPKAPAAPEPTGDKQPEGDKSLAVSQPAPPPVRDSSIKPPPVPPPSTSGDTPAPSLDVG